MCYESPRRPSGPYVPPAPIASPTPTPAPAKERSPLGKAVAALRDGFKALKPQTEAVGEAYLIDSFNPIADGEELGQTFQDMTHVLGMVQGFFKLTRLSAEELGARLRREHPAVADRILAEAQKALLESN